MKISHQWRDELYGRNVARVVLHNGDIYIETEGNHDGTVVCTAVKISRAKFAAGIREIGGVL